MTWLLANACDCWPTCNCDVLTACNCNRIPLPVACWQCPHNQCCIDVLVMMCQSNMLCVLMLLHVQLLQWLDVDAFVDDVGGLQLLFVVLHHCCDQWCLDATMFWCITVANAQASPMFCSCCWLHHCCNDWGSCMCVNSVDCIAKTNQQCCCCFSCSPSTASADLFH